MRMSALFSLALKNIRHHLKHHLQVFLGIFLSVTFVMTTVIFIFFIHTHIANEYPDNKICFIKYYNDDMSSLADKCEDVQKINDVCCVIRTIDYSILDLDNMQNNAMEDMAFKNEILEIGNKEYKYSSSDAFKDEYKLNYGLEVSQIDNNISAFSDYLYSYYDDPFVCGNDCEKANDVLIPEQYLIMFGVPEDEYQNCIDQNFSVKFSATDNYSLVRNFNISGIIKKECFDGFPVSLIINKQANYYSDWDIVYVYVNKYQPKRFERIKSTLDDQFGVIGNICIAYEKLNFLQKQSNFVGHILLLVITCVVAAVIFYLLINVFFYIEQNQKYIAILLSLGMNSKKVSLLNMIEVGVSSFLSTILVIWCAYIISFNVDKIINSDIELVTWNWNILIIAHLIAILCFVLFFSAAIGLYTYYKASNISPCNLFQE